jgi:ELWxxDGT repeat protein
MALAAPPASGAALSSSPEGFTALPAATVFFARASSDPESGPYPTGLFATDGTAAGTRELRLCSSGCQRAASIIGRSPEYAFVIAYDQGWWSLWRTDGTQQGTLRLTATQFSGDPPWQTSTLWAEGLGRFFFAAREAGVSALWSSDGTPSGTQRLAVLPSDFFTSPYAMIEHHGSVFFFIARLYEGPQQIWRSGGTTETTELVTTLEIPLASGWISLPHGLVFVADDPEDEDAFRLWRTDGTAAGTQPLDAFAGLYTSFLGLTKIGRRGWFWASDAGERQLWVTDGSEAGTHRVASFEGFRPPSVWEPLPWQGGIVFSVHDFDHGREFWVSDGTPEGTQVLFETCPGYCPAIDGPRGVAVHEGRLYFLDKDNHLWESDGTSEGSHEVVPFRVLTISGEVPPLDFVGDVIYFRGSRSASFFIQLWALNRSTGELQQLTHFGREVSQWFSGNWSVGRVGDRLLFGANDGSTGEEPWVSDGTAAGTQVLVDLAQGNDVFFGCATSNYTLCLLGRFRVEVTWVDQHNGGSGEGRAVRPSGADDYASGHFWFFGSENIELIVKMLDGTSANGFHWLFYGALTDVEYEIEVTDTLTGERRTYHNPPGELCGEGDTAAFPGSFGGASRTGGSGQLRSLSLPAAPIGLDAIVSAAHPTATCIPDAHTLCLLDNRFRVSVEWQDQHNGGSGSGGAIGYTDVTGFFWFFTADNVELVVKALDARAVNGHFWFFYGALSDVAYTITFEDLVDGHRTRQYVNPPGEICGRGDTAAFAG